MQLRQSILVATAAAAFTTVTPALAHEGQGHGAPPSAWKNDRHAGGSVDPHARDAWLQECEDRMSDRRNRNASVDCEAILDDHYARYRGGYYGGSGYGFGHPGSGYGGGCCQPMMMVPIKRMSRGEPECTETVEYVTEYVDAPPVRTRKPRVSRPAPSKRVKIVPDKRIRTK